MLAFVYISVFCFSIGENIFTRYGAIPDNELQITFPPHEPKVSFFPQPATISGDRLPDSIGPQLLYFVGYFFGDGGLKNINKTYLKTGRREYKIIISDGSFALAADENGVCTIG